MADDKTQKNDRRLDLDALDERVAAEEQAEREKASAIVAAKSHTEPDSTPEAEQLRAENEKMRAILNRFLDTRNAAREFMTIWSDPRKLPELVQEVYLSHPDIQTLKVNMGDTHAQRASRLIAHMALTYEIHPLMNGMIYAWEQDKKVIVEIGYRGYGEMLKRNMMDYETRAMTPEECKEHGVADEDRGWLCFVHDWERVERFTKRGHDAPEPHRGVGVWRSKNRFNKPDNVPASKSNDWVAEKNAIKDAARKALSFAVTKTAQADAIDFVYSATDDAWVMPVEVADWLTFPEIVKRFEKLLVEADVTGEEFNTFLGHNWRYTQLEPDDIKTKLDEYVKQRAQTVDSAFAEPTSEPAVPEVFTQEDPKPESATINDPTSGGCFECGQVTSSKQADTGKFWCLDCAKEADEAKKAEQPKRKSKTRRQPKLATTGEDRPDEKNEQAMCSNCGLDPATGDPNSPYPGMCKDCAGKTADADAAKAA